MKFSGFWCRFGAGFFDHILVYGTTAVLVSLVGTPIVEVITSPVNCTSTSLLNCLDALWSTLWGTGNENTIRDACNNLCSYGNIAVTPPWWYTLVAWLYYSWFQSSKYQATPGMMFFLIRITTYEGEKISFLRATGRFFASFLSAFFLGIGYIMMAFTPRKQALHDYIAKTLVVKMTPR